MVWSAFIRSRRMELKQRLSQQLKESRDAFLRNPYPTYQKRLENLNKLESLIKAHQAEIIYAIEQDFGTRSISETGLLELFTSIETIRDAKKQLKKWMKPSHRHTSVWFFPAKNRVVPQPLGVVGVIVPWNYPLMLTIGPLVAALAAGNRVMLKMSQNSPHLAQLLVELFEAQFNRDEVAIYADEAEMGPEFSKLKFDHLLFTGSTKTGRAVMQSAANNLVPVTLELGGKSPVILDEKFDVKIALERLLGGKLYNCGQTCIAPDYLFVPQSRLNEVVETTKAIMAKRFSTIQHQDYTSIIDANAFERLTHLLSDAKEKGAKLINCIPNSEPERGSRKLPFYLVTEVESDMAVMQEEIFGPILPIITYQHIDEVFHYIALRPRPLALYLFSEDKWLQKKFTQETLSGGLCINDVMLHVAQHDLPFGGVGESGMGHYHGREGFNTFSKLKPVMTQSRFALTPLFYSPYSGFAKSILNVMINRKIGNYESAIQQKLTSLLRIIGRDVS
ncbi:TPA: aldehyde dehydrogenase family protein [Vibrio vulnificus]|nr:aldehyde dehydrogenase family protein [Vibrio vulnificus]